MTRALSDQAWADICAAAGRTPDAKARAELSAILFSEYPAFAYDPARETARLERSTRMLKQLGEFAEAYRQEWLPRLAAAELQAILTRRAVPWQPRRMNFKPTFDAKTERDLRALRNLYLRAESVWHYASRIVSAHKGQQSVQRAWLYYRLCTVWLDHFDDELAYSRPSLGGEPRGPLVEFLRACFKQVVPRKLPGTEAVAKAIVRERRDRERLKQLILQLW